MFPWAVIVVCLIFLVEALAVVQLSQLRRPFEEVVGLIQLSELVVRPVDASTSQRRAGHSSQLTSISELFDKFIVEHFTCRGRLDDLEQKFGGCLGFLYPSGELVGRRNATGTMVVRGEIILLVWIEWRRVQHSR